MTWCIITPTSRFTTPHLQDVTIYAGRPFRGRSQKRSEPVEIRVSRIWESTDLVVRTVFKTAEAGATRLVISIMTLSRQFFGTSVAVTRHALRVRRFAHRYYLDCVARTN